ncbi:MAG: hypothetical protein RSG92_15340 [Pseudomonas sp.]
MERHASHPGYLSIGWRRIDNYREAGIQPMPMWVPEGFGVHVGDALVVTVEFSAAIAKATGSAA